MRRLDEGISCAAGRLSPDCRGVRQEASLCWREKHPPHGLRQKAVGLEHHETSVPFVAARRRRYVESK